MPGSKQEEGPGKGLGSRAARQAEARRPGSVQARQGRERTFRSPSASPSLAIGRRQEKAKELEAKPKEAKKEPEKQDYRDPFPEDWCGPPF